MHGKEAKPVADPKALPGGSSLVTHDRFTIAKHEKLVVPRAKLSSRWIAGRPVGRRTLPMLLRE